MEEQAACTNGIVLAETASQSNTFLWWQGFNRASNVLKRRPGDDFSYNEILCSLINGLNYKHEVIILPIHFSAELGTRQDYRDTL